MSERSGPRPARLLPLLFRELKRRGVLRAASLYVVGAWVMIQAADVILPSFGFSDRVVAAVVLLAVAGFPVVVVLSWLFRLGVDREAVTAEAALAGRPLSAAVGLAMLVGVAVLGTSAWIVLRGGEPPAPASAADTPRVAVLYFTALGESDDRSYLAPAVTTALIDHLGAAQGLTVISRDGVAPFRNRAVAPDSLARALDIELLVSGTVLESGSQVRVAAELTDPRSGALLAAITVDRPAGAPLALIDAVVKEVADSLLTRMGREQRLRHWQAGTSSHEAWTLLQRAQQAQDHSRELNGRGEAAAALAELDVADSLLQRAAELDRGYHAATVQRAEVARNRALVLVRRGDDAQVAAVLERGEGLADRVLGHGPHAAAYEVRGVLRELRHAFAPPADSAAAAALLAAAETDLRAAIRLEPRRPRALQVLSSVLDTRGAFGEALHWLEEAYRVDAYQANALPTVDRLFTINFELARDEEADRWCAELMRRKGAGMQTATCALQLAAWSAGPRLTPAQAQALVDSAIAAEPAAAEAYGRSMLDVLLAGVLARTGHGERARALLAEVRARGNPHPELLQLEAGVRVLLGDYDVATALLQRYGSEQRGSLLAGSRRFAPLPLNPLAPARRRGVPTGRA